MLGTRKNMRKEIPQRAFINAEIVQSVEKLNEEKLNDWGKAVSSILEKYKLEQYQFMNPAYVASLLYCLFVVPKEIWVKRNKHHPVFKKIDQNELRDRIEYTSTNHNFDADFAYNFVVKLRNAVAHVNYEFDKNMDFEFWDRDYNSKKENFHCKVDAKALMWLLSVVGAELANLKTSS
jgi:hypothetical protein